eukprot:1924738-Rhodomonas_salina.1
MIRTANAIRVAPEIEATHTCETPKTRARRSHTRGFQSHVGRYWRVRGVKCAWSADDHSLRPKQTRTHSDLGASTRKRTLPGTSRPSQTQDLCSSFGRHANPRRQHPESRHRILAQENANERCQAPDTHRISVRVHHLGAALTWAERSAAARRSNRRPGIATVVPRLSAVGGQRDVTFAAAVGPVPRAARATACFSAADAAREGRGTSNEECGWCLKLACSAQNHRHHLLVIVIVIVIVIVTTTTTTTTVVIHYQDHYHHHHPSSSNTTSITRSMIGSQPRGADPTAGTCSKHTHASPSAALAPRVPHAETSANTPLHPSSRVSKTLFVVVTDTQKKYGSQNKAVSGVSISVLLVCCSQTQHSTCASRSGIETSRTRPANSTESQPPTAKARTVLT